MRANKGFLVGGVGLHPVSKALADEGPPSLDFLDEQSITAHGGSFPAAGPSRRDKCGSDKYSGSVEQGVEILVRGACKSWKCEHCAEVKAAMYRRGITRLAKEHDLATFGETCSITSTWYGIGCSLVCVVVCI